MRRCQGRKYRLLQRTEGATAVELALVLPVLLLILLGIMDFGNVYYQMHIVSEAAREGARRLAINPSADVTTFIHTNYGSQLSVDAPPAAPGNDVTVTVTNSVTINTPLISAFFPHNPFNVTGKTVMRVE